MIQIRLNNEKSIEKEHNRNYFGYNVIKYNENEQRCFKSPIEDGEGVLYASFSGPEGVFGKREPDLDNLLLYNMKLEPRNYRAVILEKKLSPDNKTNTEYNYQIGSTVPDISGEFVIDTGYLFFTKEPTGEGDKVIFFYNLFREWLCKQKEKDINSIEENLKDKDFGMAIYYNGQSNLSESGFIKRVIDGVISAMEAFNPSTRIRDNYRQAIDRGDINPGCCKTSVLPSDNHFTINGNGWNPQDHLLNKVVIIKNNDQNQKPYFFRVQIGEIMLNSKNEPKV